jgi:hypothetical protein
MMKRDTKLVLYQTESGSVEVRLDESKDNVFLTQQQVGELFDVQKAAISKHVNNIFKSGELDKKNNCFQNGNSSKRGK